MMMMMMMIIMRRRRRTRGGRNEEGLRAQHWHFPDSYEIILEGEHSLKQDTKDTSCQSKEKT